MTDDQRIEKILGLLDQLDPHKRSATEVARLSREIKSEVRRFVNQGVQGKRGT